VLLTAIDESRKASDAEVDQGFERIRPLVLGALLDAAAVALRNLGSVTLTSRPRMFAFAQWVVAGESAMPWEPGAFEETYSASRADAHEAAIETSAVGSAVVLMMNARAMWTGTPTEFLAAIADVGRSGLSTRPDFPKFVRTATDSLTRLQVALRARGIYVSQGKSHGVRFVKIEKTS